MTMIKAALFFSSALPGQLFKNLLNCLVCFPETQSHIFLPHNNNGIEQHQDFTNIHSDLPERVHVVAWYGPFQQNLNILSVKEMKYDEKSPQEM